MARLVATIALIAVSLWCYPQGRLTVKTVSTCTKIVELKWRVKSEDHIDRYVIEWSKDGAEYDSIASVEGCIYNPKPTTYRWYDNVEHIKATDTHYYRIRTVWVDGGYAWCKPVSVSCKPSKAYKPNNL
jgi:hypothetical protein